MLALVGEVGGLGLGSLAWGSDCSSLEGAGRVSPSVWPPDSGYVDVTGSRRDGNVVRESG